MNNEYYGQHEDLLPECYSYKTPAQR